VDHPAALGAVALADLSHEKKASACLNPLSDLFKIQ
jgi:hypothetical protein